jgi:hypothetical protein
VSFKQMVGRSHIGGDWEKKTVRLFTVFHGFHGSVYYIGTATEDWQTETETDSVFRFRFRLTVFSVFPVSVIHAYG